MGHPKKLKKKYEHPKRPFEGLAEDKKTIREFGLRKKREMWRAETDLRNIRRRARDLQAKKGDKKDAELPEEKALIEKLKHMGIEVNTLDDILRLRLEDLLSRRLQTIAFKKGIGSTIKQSRQLIVHGHVKIDGRKVKFPSLIVPSECEERIESDFKAAAKEKPQEKKADEKQAEAPAEETKGEKE